MLSRILITQGKIYSQRAIRELCLPNIRVITPETKVQGKLFHSIPSPYTCCEADVGVHFLFSGLDGEEVVVVADVVVVFPLLDFFEFLILVGVGEDFAVGFPDRGLPVFGIAGNGGIFAEGVHDDGFFDGVDGEEAFQDLGDTRETGGEVEVNDFAVGTFLGAGRVIGVGDEDLGVVACGAENSKNFRMDEVGF